MRNPPFSLPALYCEVYELEEIDPEVRHLPEILEVRLSIYRGLKKWELMEVVARKLKEYDPDNPQWPLLLAYATRRSQSIESARAILLDACVKHTREPLIPFDLACYDCELGILDAAREMLTLAFSLNPRLRLMALDDEDLKPL